MAFEIGEGGDAEDPSYRHQYLGHQEASPGHHRLGTPRQRPDDGSPFLGVGDVMAPAGRDVVPREQEARPQQQAYPQAGEGEEQQRSL